MISTLAGTGSRGSAGDGGPAERAQLAEPVSVAVDPAGNVYVGEEGSARVRRIGLDGTIETVAGTAEIATPIDLSIGPDGSLFVLDTDRPSLRSVDRQGVISTVVGTGEAGILADSGHTISRDLCGRPLGFAFDPKGAVHVACSNAHRVVRVEPDGSFTTVAGSSGSGYAGDGGRATNARLNGPFSIAFDSAGNLYIADSGNHRVRKVDTAGVITTFAGTGRPGVSGDGFRASFVDLWTPVGVEVDAHDNVYVLELGVSRIRKIDRNGIMTTVAGTGRAGFSGDGGSAVEAALGSPVGFAVDRHGTIFIADRNNHRVRKVTVGGETERG